MRNGTKQNFFEYFQRFFVEAVKVVFATPAAIAVLGQLDKRINLTPTLERLVLSYDKIIIYAYESLERVAKIDQEYIELLAFLFFVILQFSFSWALQDKRKSSFLWGIASAISIILLFGAFNVQDSVFLGGQILDPLFEIGGPVLIIFLLRTWVRIEKQNEDTQPKLSKNYLLAAYAVLSLDAIVSALDFFIGNSHISKFGEPYPSLYFWEAIIVASFYATSLIILLLSVILKVKGPAYILLWAFGIFFVNWLAESAIPSIDNWIDSVVAMSV